ncbi:MAG: 1-aminocyclopropane-1-carboxylate deaminase/D-cysteine desulfhydrase [Vicingus serpentipes]|nr:1-aminocyclopropane-1-carboxylate deaminase/D-cysteine desulfhydrase [Vicingus serpentipes]
MLSVNENSVPVQELEETFLKEKKIRLYLLREDLIHPEISGNKWRKLKYNIKEAKQIGYHQLLTYGGAYSNHIAATAAAGRAFGFKTIGVIRGDEVLPLNATLQLAHNNGMQLKFVSRSTYSTQKYEPNFLAELEQEYGKFYRVPEGGSNEFAVKGCTEIMKKIKVDYDVVCCACGTGGTMSGIISSLDSSKQVLGFPALKGGDFLKEEITNLLVKYSNAFKVEVENNNWELITDYHFGGYAKVNRELIDFVKEFKEKHDVLLDLIYTGKLLFGLFDQIKNSTQFDGKKIIVVHTGGLQGNKGFEERLGINL